MDRTEIVPLDHALRVLEAIFTDPVRVYEEYSRFEERVSLFEDWIALGRVIAPMLSLEKKHVLLVAHFQRAGGYVEVRRINLNPEKCDGATWREKVEGWGLVQLQLQPVEDSMIEFRIAVNSEKRAQNWYPTFPELQSPSTWDWAVVEKQVRRLIRLLRRSA